MTTMKKKEKDFKKKITRLYIYNIVLFMLIGGLIVFVGGLYQVFYKGLEVELYEYRSNPLFQISEIEKIELFREELHSGNWLIWKYAQELKSNEEVYFYLKHNEEKKNVLELYALLYRDKELVENEYLFDINVNLNIQKKVSK